MNFFPRLLTRIALGSFGLSLLMMGTTAQAAGELQWRSAGQASTQHLAPPQNGKVKNPLAQRYATKKVATSGNTKIAQTSATAPVEGTTAKRTTIKRTSAKTTSKKTSGVRQAAVYTPTLRQAAPWQQRKQASFGMPGVRMAKNTTGGVSRTRTVSDGEIIMTPEAEEHLGDAFHESSCSSCSDGSCGGCDSCSGCGSCGDTSCCFPFMLPSLDNITVFGGPEGFKGPADAGENGNFGFGVGLNLAGPLWECQKIGYQLGGRYTRSNYNGTTLGGTYDGDDRSQTFVTAGIFRRAQSCCPWQWGIAYDYLRDDYHYEANLSQLRIELSRHACWGNELGVLVMQRIKRENGLVSRPLGTIDIESENQYLFFLRRRFDNCGEGRLWGGVSGDSDGIVGGDFRMALNSSLALVGDFNYLFAEGDSSVAQQEDSYSIGLNLVWHPRCRAREAGSNPFRALFNVANNSTLMTRRQ